jgi:hypothetical protein
MTRLLLSVLFWGAALHAQHTHGYFFVAPGGASAGGHTGGTIHLGLGGEFGLNRWLGVGAEIGALGPTSDFTGGVVGVLSPNAYVHFAGTDKFDPYATGGYSLMFRSGHANLVNFGAGMNYWFRERIALMLEFRDHVTTGSFRVNYWGVRIGLSFR